MKDWEVDNPMIPLLFADSPSDGDDIIYHASIRFCRLGFAMILQIYTILYNIL